MTIPSTMPALRTIKAHGFPDRALWYGRASVPDTKPVPCAIAAVPGGFHVRCDDGTGHRLGATARVWLGPLLDTQGNPAQVLNPEPVHLRLRTATTGTYLALRAILIAASNVAENHALTATSPTTEQEFRTVRDALRRAATDCAAPYPADKAPACRRCGAGCPQCLLGGAR